MVARGAIFIYLCFLWFTHTSQNFEKQQMLEMAASMCPFTNFCHANATRNLGTGQMQDDLCCLPCSCEPDCWETDSCCIDKENISGKMSPLNCKETLVNKKDNNTRFHGVRRYFIVDFCPEAQKNSVVDMKCKAEHPAILEEFIWVADKVTGLIYQNQYCAECHGVKDFVYWQIKTDCHALLRANFSSLFNDISLHTCTINNESPDSIRSKSDKYKCLKPGLKECNETGKWEKYDHDIATACATLYSPVFQPDSETNAFNPYNLYSNVFCYICNGGRMRDFSAFCPGKNKYMVRTAGVGFSALINYNKYAEVLHNAKDVEQYTPRCHIDEVFDIYTERCRTLVCPFGRTPVYEWCEQVLTEIDGLVVPATYHLKTLSVTNSSTLFSDRNKLESIGEDIIKLFRTSSGLQRSRCPICSFYVFTDTDFDEDIPTTASFYLEVNLLTDTKCSLEKMSKLSSAFVDKTWTVYITDIDYLVFRSEYSARTYSEMTPNLITAMQMLPKCVAKFSSEPLCPAIDLKYSETFSLKERKTRELLLAFFKTKQQSSGVLRVCLKSYYSLMSQIGSAAAHDLLVGNHSLILAIFIFCFTL